MSLVLDRISKSYRSRHGRRDVFAGLDAVFEPGRSLGILGGPGSGKSTLMQIAAGALEPDAGHVRRRSRASFLVGTGALANSRLTMREIVTFTARLYGANVRHVIDFVADFGELGPYMNKPVDPHSRDRKGRLLFTLSYALPFDLYMADENLVGGSPQFRERCASLVHERRKTCGLVFATRNVRNLTAFADEAAVLHEGRLTFYPTLDEAIAAYQALNPRWQSFSRAPDEDEEDEEDDADTMMGFF